MNSLFYQDGFEVPAKSKQQIDIITQSIRLMFSDIINSDGAIDILALLENKYGEFNVVEDQELPHALGLTLPNGMILLRESVYNGAFDGNGRDRFTIAHELGHGIMHRGHIGFARKATKNTKTYCNAEWQANEFAGRLLLPDNALITNSTLQIYELSEKFGVSLECAQTRVNKFNK